LHFLRIEHMPFFPEAVPIETKVFKLTFSTGDLSGLMSVYLS